MTTATATLVFTDLVGSTALGRILRPEEGEDLRQTHFSILREAITATGGMEVKNLGDGLMVAFASPSRALACAVAMQQGIERHNRRSPHPLAVRIGVAGGEVTEDDGDYFGDPVIEAARLCALAEGGQVLATDTVRAMVGRHATVELVPVGDLELKGIAEPVRTVEAKWMAAAAAGGVPMPVRLVEAASRGAFAFAGRAAELATLEDVCKRADAGRLQIALIGGEPGVGKTSLAAQAARQAHAEGATVIFGSSQDGLGVPYQPWIAALAHLLTSAPETITQGLTSVQRGALRSLLPAVDDRLLGDDADVDVDAETERYLRLEAIAGLLERASAESAVIVVLDDLHWADIASLDVLRHLVRSSAPLHVAVIATFRDSDLSRGHPLAALLAELRREQTAARIDLSGLADDEVIELMEVAAGYELPPEGIALAHAIRRETDGNPFFTEELLRNLAETGALQLAPDGRYALAGDVESLAMPSSVREVIADRVARLGDETVDVLSMAAVIGQEFELDLLAAVTETDVDRLIEILVSAGSAALVVESADVAGHYRFVHALIAHTLSQDLGPTRRQRAHQRIGEALEALGAEQTGRLAELAHHWTAATRPTDAGRALYFARRAGDAALDALAPLDAIRWYERALELFDQAGSGDQIERAWLLQRLGRAQLEAGITQHRATLEEAGRLARALGDRDLLVAIATCRLTGYENVSNVDPNRVAVIEAALDAVGDGDLVIRARLLAALAEELEPRDWKRRQELSTEAVAIVRKLGDEGALIEVIPTSLWMIQAPEQFEQRQELAALARSLAVPESSPMAEYDLLMAVHACLIQAADRAAADAIWARIEDIVDRLNTPFCRCTVLQGRSWKQLLVGDIDGAEAAMNECFELGTRIGSSAASAIFGAQLLAIRIQQGRVGEVADVVAQGVDDFDTLRDSWKAGLAVVLCELGQMDEVRELLQSVISEDFANQPRDQTWLYSMSAWAECAVELGDRSAAEAILPHLRPFAAQISFMAAFLWGAAARPLGRLEGLLGHRAQAEADLALALELHERLRSPYWIARTQLDLADLTGSPALVASASALIDQYGFDGLRPRLS